MPVSPEINSHASIPTVATPSHHDKLPENVAGYDDCTGLSESAKVNHIRNCYGYDGTRLHTSTLYHLPDYLNNEQLHYPTTTTTTTTTAATNECIDDTGSVNDEGYHFGYVDAQRGNNDAIHKHGNHTDEWRQGYRDGFAAGQQDKANGIDKHAC
jgi:hypothetical protein